MDHRRDGAVDTLRGLACLLVVAFHVRGDGPGTGLRLDGGGPWSYLVDSLVYLRMPLFTFLSGVVYAARPLRSGYPAFVRGKARRLLVPLLVVGTTFALVQTLTGNGTGTPWYLWHVVPVGHFWFLESIFWVFALVALLDRFRLLDRLPALAGVGAAGLLVDASTGVPGNVLGLGTTSFLLPFFLAGLASVRCRWLDAPRPVHVGAVLLAVVLLAWTQLGLLGVVARVPQQGSLVAGTFGVVGCLCLLLVRRRVRVLMVVGGFSFTIYTCHVFATAATRDVLHAVGVHSTSLHMVLGTAAGVAFGIGVEVLARRWGWSAALVLGRRWPRSAGRGRAVRERR